MLQVWILFAFVLRSLNSVELAFCSPSLSLLAESHFLIWGTNRQKQSDLQGATFLFFAGSTLEDLVVDLRAPFKRRLAAAFAVA